MPVGMLILHHKVLTENTRKDIFEGSLTWEPAPDGARFAKSLAYVHTCIHVFLN